MSLPVFPVDGAGTDLVDSRRVERAKVEGDGTKPGPSADEAAGGDETPATRPPSAGPSAQQIGKYRIQGVLGKGGMGVVYRALDPFLEREVALKVMLPQVAEDADHKQRFEREARAVARLSHPNVVTVFDLGYHTDGAPYIVMELLRGRDLLHVTSHGPPLSLGEKVAIVLQVLRGLGQAHRLGIVHRDIKPANVFITDDGAAKIMDFGVARLGSSLATGAGAIVGTAAYMSPEQVKGEPVDGRSDIFSVASMLCELLCGRRPFHEETPVATLYSIAQKEPFLDLPAGPEFQRLVPVLKRALAKDREERFATCDDFADALASCLDEASLTAGGAVLPLRPSGGSGKGTAVGLKTTKPLAPPAVEALAPAVGPAGRRADPTGLFRILRDVYVRGKSGHLHFRSGRTCRSLRVLKGHITHAISDRDGEHLGEVLVRYGVISQRDLERALESEKRLGPVLSGMGLLDHEKLRQVLGLHVREVLFAMLEATEGSADGAAGARRHEPPAGALRRPAPALPADRPHARGRLRSLAHRRHPQRPGGDQPEPGPPGGHGAEPLRAALHRHRRLRAAGWNLPPARSRPPGNLGGGDAVPGVPPVPLTSPRHRLRGPASPPPWWPPSRGGPGRHGSRRPATSD
jgi:hypothetical protein